MAQLKDLRSARELVDFISAQDWNTVSADDRLTALHQINTAICKLRERNGLPLDDPLPGERTNAFLLIKSKLFPRERREAPPDARSSGQ
jgi:hypothetical protein